MFALRRGNARWVLRRPAQIAVDVHALLAPPALDDESGRNEIRMALVDALARLHDVDWRSAGLADLGRPDGFHERQVERWKAQLD
jgi:aminoglycoside phosphotransferase (APT) family kinase protein